MRLVEQLIQEGSGDFLVEAETPALAAGFLLGMHDAARERDSNIVALADGQSCRIEPNSVVENSTFCILLDETGQEIREVEPDWEGPTADERQQAAEDADGTPQASTTEPRP